MIDRLIDFLPPAIVRRIVQRAVARTGLAAPTLDAVLAYWDAK